MKKPKPPKPPKKITKKKQLALARSTKRKALVNWSKSVRDRDKKCSICGSEVYLQAHHILDKRYFKENMYDIGIGILLCVKCHKWGKYAAHTNALFFSKWLENNRPDQYNYCMQIVKERSTTG